MSKLRADITWKHRKNSDSSILTPLSIASRNEEENNNSEKDAEKNLVIIDDSSKEGEEKDDEEDEDEDDDDDDLEKEFNNYLQGWSDMLKEETYEFEENETVDGILHPAIDPNAKWNLSSLFKELEFLF